MTRTPHPVLQFIGGAGTVTGSKTLLDSSGGRLLVDCGLFQGRKDLRLMNWDTFPVEPSSIDAVVLTHAHLDHCGYLPRLCALGFTGPVYCTDGTASLAKIVLADSAHLQEEEADFANRMGYSKHRPALPLYTAAEALASFEHLHPVEFAHPFEPVPGVQARLRRAGHILGAASVQFDLQGDGTIGHSRLVFSGDLGRSIHPLLLPPDPVDGWHDDDAPLDVVTESTYGDEQHVATDVDAQIAAAVNMACKRGGVVIVPAFAVDRTEVVLWHLDQLVGSGAIPDIPIFVDSPMASRALELYRQEVKRGSPEIRPELTGRKLFANLNLVETRSVEESRALGERHGPFVIVSASGMVTGGRVVHHLAQRIGDDRNVVVLAGFQAPGTRGDLLRHGATTIKMLGQHHPVRAHVVSVDLSTHADQFELLAWLGTAPRPPRMVYVNHGEPDASSALAAAIEARHIPAVVARHGERVRLGG